MANYAETMPGTNAIRPTSPVNSALSTSMEQLMRCEGIVRNIRSRIHGSSPESASDSASKPYMPDGASALSNTLADRLQSLGDVLQDVENSF